MRIQEEHVLWFVWVWLAVLLGGAGAYLLFAVARVLLFNYGVN